MHNSLWSPRWSGDLLSAICGGQWPQARKAEVRDWQIDDLSCQLCFSAVGTLEHRFCCPVTCPAEGWPTPPDAARNLLSKLSEPRRRWLRTRGMLILRVPAGSAAQNGDFRWHREPDPNDPRLQDATWYFDGSMLQGKWVELRTTGFGIAVVSDSGDLLGFGFGSPPGWCATAAAAEAWALQEVLRCCPCPPRMRTDCQALLAVIEQGQSSATASHRPLARIWSAISHALDGDFGLFHHSGLLVWMPAHCSLASVGEVKLSNGARLSMIDWRANRLVDALAKRAAARRAASPACIALLDAAGQAARHAAMLLGRVTHASNHFVHVTTDPDGKRTVQVRRDASQTGRHLGAGTRATSAPPAVQAISCTPAVPGGWSIAAVATMAPTAIPVPLSQAAKAAGARRSTERDFLARRVAAIGASLSAPSDQPTAAERMQALRARVRARSAGQD